MGEPAGRAVQRPLDHAEPGGDGRVGVRAGRCGDAHGERGGGQVVVDEQGECRVQDAQGRLVGGTPAEPGPQAVGEGAVVAVVVPARGQGGDERRDQGARRAEHGVLGQVEAQRVRGRGGDRRDPQPVGGAGVFGQRVDRAAGGGDGGCGRREGGAGVQLARPQPLGDLLVGVPCGQFGRVDAAEVVAVRSMSVMRVRTDSSPPDARTPAALPPVAPGERLHLPGVEGAAPAAGSRAGC